jgi:hypothetical protein
MRVFGMGVGRVMVVVIMVVVIVITVTVIMVVVIMVVVVEIVTIQRLQPAHASAERIAKLAICYVRTRRIRTLAFNVVVVAFLHSADFGLKAEYLGAVFAQNTCRWRDRTKGRMAAVFDANLVGFAVF